MKKHRAGFAPDKIGEKEAAELISGIGGSAGGTLSARHTDGAWIADQSIELSLYPNWIGRGERREIHVENNKMLAHVINGDGDRVSNDHFERLSELGQSEITGAWKLQADDANGLFVMLDTQYRLLITANDRPNKDVADMSPAETLELFRGTRAQAGSYLLSNDHLVLTPEAALNPYYEHVEQRANFDLDGDRLTIDLAGAERVWTRSS